MTSVAAVSKKINSIQSKRNSITIYHTNDLHGNFAPVAGNLGGLNQVKTLLKKQDISGLLFDAGDFLNGAHNVTQQKETVYAMNKMGYLAATVGNHELSHGQDALAALIPSMQFNLVNCNYQFDNALNSLIKPYIIIRSGNYKIGITGVGHQLKGVKYNDAIACANNTATLLKEKEKCDLVIVLSHLGYSQKGDLPDNQKLAQSSENIDLIISGHNRKLLPGAVICLNKFKKEVIVSQAAWDGLMMGRVVFGFRNGNEKSDFRAKNLIAGQAYGQTDAAGFAELRSIQKQLVSA